MAYKGKYSGAEIDTLLDEVKGSNEKIFNSVRGLFGYHTCLGEISADNLELVTEQDNILLIEENNNNEIRGTKIMRSGDSLESGSFGKKVTFYFEQNTDEDYKIRAVAPNGFSTSLRYFVYTDNHIPKHLEEPIIFDFDKLEDDYIQAPLAINDEQMQLATGMSIIDFADKIATGVPCYCRFNGLISSWDIKICNDDTLMIQWPGAEYKAVLAIEDETLMVQVQSDTTITEDIVSQWGFTKNEGTVTKVKINGTEKVPDANGIVDLGTVEGGSSSIVEVGIDSTGGFALNKLTPNTVYICTGLVTGTLSISQSVAPPMNYAEYNICFTTGSASSIPCSFPDTWIYANGQLPIFKANTSYEISIVYNKVGSQDLYKVVITPFKSANTPQ